MNIQDWFPCSPRDSQESSPTHSSKASILRHSAFLMVQLSHSYVTTGKTIALTRWTFVGQVMSLHFNMLSKLVIAFLAKSKHLLISWLQSPSAVILEPPKIKSLTYGMCVSLNKSTSHLSVYLSMNSFCDETLRTWGSRFTGSWIFHHLGPSWF